MVVRIGLTPTESTCDTDGDPPTYCAGLWTWADGSALAWAATEHDSWAPGILSNNLGQDCGCLWNGQIRDVECHNLAFEERAICQIDCTNV